ncbi:LOW QUALITY PROTEIN: protein bangles and beads [Drosophila sulfurigaster albostrigata]|uniref:LOW QUALITY PROTEIN: protein bangles and beads n=1 Tax=Drosophila sulfurigaster albostrigata TaxID=89887 RepID=UPI002D21E634|nr:LOW QUALITY PROTEIN: protein bangles and beads [Drosophila sulfurigaster albostrigata]
MSSSKKRSKDEQIPKPISIKKEKSEEDRTLQPISHYIDDRLELVKQIFGTLKPKTIMNLAPEFLKKTSLDEIEELCLNELLCISTKRLKSIIADTRCPTDTESSEDSDVEHKEEHISLEEISSDSDIGGSETRRAKKLRKSNAKRADKTNENKEPDGQISVLELLELQARARAIRSQLAMEPITKIEVKSDDEEEETSKRSSEKEKSREKRSHRSSEQSSSKRKSSEQSRREQAQTNGSKPKEITAPAPAPAQKKIKLKRNYRTSTKTPEKELTPVVKATSQPEISQDKSDRSRSASPDVIPIPAEPETLLISDSTDDEATVKPKEPIEQVKVVPAPIPEPAPEPAELSEPEEGEVREESENETEAEPVKKTAEEELPIEATTVETEKPVEIAAAEAVPVESTDVEKPSTSNQPIVEAEQPQLSSSIVDDEDQNDDVISIGGDLEHEMIAELAEVTDEPPVKVKPEKLPDPEEEDNDVISLNTSEDEHEKLQETNSESWRTRYLKSSKVNQVLAASRLGKRVRDKIKESKRNGDEKSSKQSQQQQFTSKHEDGSMEQYQELLQHRQRKSSNSSKGDK